MEGEISEFLKWPSTSTSLEPDETESYKWNHNTTLLFLDLYKEYRKQVGSLKIKNFKKMFDQIAKELRHKTKQNITAANCENRWKHLERTYKKYIDNNNKTGRGRRDFEYADVMDTILGNKRNIRPIILLSSDTIHTQTEKKSTTLIDTDVEKENIENEQVHETTQKTTEVVPRKIPVTTKLQVPNSYKNKKLRINILKEIRNDRKDFYRKFLDMEEKKLREKQRKNDILEERNALLKQFVNKELPVSHIEAIS